MGKRLILVVGKSVSGKSMSLKGIKDPSGVAYLNCESAKELPFREGIKFKTMVITDPLQVYDAFDMVEEDEYKDVHSLVVDSLTYLIDMYESIYVVPHAGSKKGQAAWGDYAQFFKKLMQHYVAKSTKTVVMTAHTADIINESEQCLETVVKVKGSLMNNGIESFFTNIVAAKRMTVANLKKSGAKSEYLNITEEEEELGYKHVFQTRITKDTVHERIRGPIGMWERKHVFIDNNIQHVIDRLDWYYSEDA